MHVFSMHGPLSFQVSLYTTTRTKKATPVTQTKQQKFIWSRFMTATKAKTQLTAQTHTVLALASCRVNHYYLAKEAVKSQQIPILICQNYFECVNC